MPPTTPVPRPPALLFSPFQLRDVTFANRIVIGRMHMYVADADGIAGIWQSMRSAVPAPS